MKHYVFLRKIRANGNWGGCENRICRYFSAVDYRLNKVTLLTTHDIFSKEFKKRDMPVHVRNYTTTNSNSGINLFKHLYSLLVSIEADRAVFVQGDFRDFRLSEFLAAFLATKGNIYSLEVLGAPKPPEKVSKRYLKYFKGLGLWWYKEMFYYWLRGRLCKSVLAVSEEVRSRMINWYGYPKEKVVKVCTDIDTKKFSSDSMIKKKMRQQYDIPDEDTVIISTARLSQEKCIHRLIDAFEKISHKYKNCWLLIVGDGPLKKNLEDLVRSKPSLSRIKFLGFQENISDFLAMSEIYVLPSDIEGVATAALEAMSSALVCVATQTPGPNEFIHDGINGFLVERSNEGVLEGLKKAIVLTNEQREQIASNARSYILSNHVTQSNENSAVKILGLVGGKNG